MIFAYPVKDGDELTDEACGKVKELWLQADEKRNMARIDKKGIENGLVFE